MKKILLLLAVCWIATSVNAQILRTEELEKYVIQLYGDKWEDSAASLATEVGLDQNNALTYTQIVEAPGKTKEQLYIILNYWFTVTFNDANSVIKLNDKEAGTIIGQGYIDDIASHTGGMNDYTVSARPIIKCDIKDNKVRITYTVPYYEVVKMIGGGWVAKTSDTSAIRSDEKWTMDACFPFVAKDKHKKTSSKAFLMAHAYSMVVMDKIEAAVKNGVAGNETDDW